MKDTLPNNTRRLQEPDKHALSLSESKLAAARPFEEKLMSNPNEDTIVRDQPVVCLKRITSIEQLQVGTCYLIYMDSLVAETHWTTRYCKQQEVELNILVKDSGTKSVRYFSPNKLGDEHNPYTYTNKVTFESIVDKILKTGYIFELPEGLNEVEAAITNKGN